jgi:hypothetical protein
MIAWHDVLVQHMFMIPLLLNVSIPHHPSILLLQREIILQDCWFPSPGNLAASSHLSEILMEWIWTKIFIITMKLTSSIEWWLKPQVGRVKWRLLASIQLSCKVTLLLVHVYSVFLRSVVLKALQMFKWTLINLMQGIFSEDIWCETCIYIHTVILIMDAMATTIIFKCISSSFSCHVC